MTQNLARKLLRRGVPLLLLAGAGTAVKGDDRPLQPLPSGLEEHEAVRRVTWPVFVEPHRRRGEPGVCRDLDAASILVTEDGQPARVTSLDREPRPTLHAILLDTSGSMRFEQRLEYARQAAKRYLTRLAPRDRAVVLTFDNDLIMRSPLTRLDREGALEELKQAIDRIDAVGATVLRDALFQLIRLLDGYPERKVVVLLSDGFDTMSRQTPSTIRGLAATSPGQNLTIFPIGLRLPKVQNEPSRVQQPPKIGSPPTGPRPSVDRGWNPRPFLMDLADNTGGQFFEVDRPAELARTFQRIQDRLDGEVYISYVPAPLGRGPKDPRDAEYTFRRVRVESTDRRCTVTNPRRERFVYAERHQPAPPARARSDVGEDDSLFPHPARVSIPFPAGWTDQAEGRSFLILRPGMIIGRTTEMVREWGPLYDQPTRQAGQDESEDDGHDGAGGGAGSDNSPAGDDSSLGAAPADWDFELPPIGGDPWDDDFEPPSFDDEEQRPELRIVPPDEAEFGSRMFFMQVASLDVTLRRRLSQPEDVLLYWLLNDIYPELPPGMESEERLRNVLHGQTFLEVRPYLARAIFKYYPDYRAWALERLRIDLDEEIRAAFPQAPEDVIARLIEARLDAPRPAELQRYLAAWLGDIDALDLVHALEQRSINELLRVSADSLELAQQIADTVALRWSALRYWFRPPESWRVMTPLLQFYDEQRELTGFVRLIQPRVGWEGQPVRSIPERPWALEVVRWLLEHPRVFDELRGRWQLIDFGTREVPKDQVVQPPRKRRPRKKPETAGTVREVMLAFESSLADAPTSGFSLKLYVEAGEDAWKPVCLSALPGQPADTIRMETAGSDCPLTQRVPAP